MRFKCVVNFIFLKHNKKLLSLLSYPQILSDDICPVGLPKDKKKKVNQGHSEVNSKH